MVRRRILAATSGLFFGARLFDSVTFDNFTKFVVLSFKSPGVYFSPITTFFFLISFEVFVASTFLFTRYKREALLVWLLLIAAQFSANIYSLVGALDSTCGTGLFRDSPYSILTMHTFFLGLLSHIYYSLFVRSSHT